MAENEHLEDVQTTGYSRTIRRGRAMQAVQDAIRDAKNAGYQPTDRSVFLDHRFWRALGRARKWDESEKLLAVPPDMWTSIWLRHWHEFIDHLAAGGKIDTFFANLEK
jgi:hypothetical protein